MNWVSVWQDLQLKRKINGLTLDDSLYFRLFLKITQGWAVLSSYTSLIKGFHEYKFGDHKVLLNCCNNFLITDFHLTSQEIKQFMSINLVICTLIISKFSYQLPTPQKSPQLNTNETWIFSVLTNYILIHSYFPLPHNSWKYSYNKKNTYLKEICLK